MCTASTQSSTLSLHDALPILNRQITAQAAMFTRNMPKLVRSYHRGLSKFQDTQASFGDARHGESRSEEHTSELQSLRHLVCRLLLEKKNDRTRQIGSIVEPFV